MLLNLKMAKLGFKAAPRDNLQKHAVCVDGFKIVTEAHCVSVHGIKAHEKYTPSLLPLKVVDKRH